jgi:hypothetical protein
VIANQTAIVLLCAHTAPEEVGTARIMSTRFEDTPWKRKAAISVIWFLLLPACLAYAQSVPRYEVFGGFSYLRLDEPAFGFANHGNQLGWNGSGAVNLTRQFGVILDASGAYGAHASTYNFAVGPQVSWRRDKSRFFAHALFGKADDHITLLEPQPFRTEFTGVSLAYVAGGGFDLYVNKRITFRVVQADYLHTHTFGSPEQNVRVSTGVVVNFGELRKHRKK